MKKHLLPVENLYETPRNAWDMTGWRLWWAPYEQFPGKDILVIDAGTCITYEFIDAAGRYHGGNISPGVQMRFRALHEFTGRLPLVLRGGTAPAVGQRYRYGNARRSAERYGI